MNLYEKKYLYVRSLLFLAIFIGLHYAYKFFPIVIFQIFSGIYESVFQHMKIGFYAYIILTVIEFFIFKKKITNNTKFLFSRAFSMILYPYLIFLFFLFTRVVYPWQMHFVIEIISAQITVYISVLFLGFIEVDIMKLEFGKRLKVLLLILLVLLIIEFTAFSFYLPWHDILANPYA
ncbi:MAG: hypothetical protein KGD74_00675 [Candidatus Lokiarchaeota archaeon]|nr:hypothetical protein [Candidatus Lokiarchaeota archaeon]